MHVNNCKEWKEMESAVLKVIVADEIELDNLQGQVSRQ